MPCYDFSNSQRVTCLVKQVSSMQSPQVFAKNSVLLWEQREKMLSSSLEMAWAGVRPALHTDQWYDVNPNS